MISLNAYVLAPKQFNEKLRRFAGLPVRDLFQFQSSSIKRFVFAINFSTLNSGGANAPAVAC